MIKNDVPSQNTIEEEDIPIDVLRAKYSRGFRYFLRDWKLLKRPGEQWLCDSLLLTAILLVLCVSLFFFATPVTEIGGEKNIGQTSGLYSLVCFSENSLLSQISEEIATFTNAINSGDITDVTAALSSITSLSRLIFLFLPAAVVGIKSIVYFLSALKKFLKAQSLATTAVKTTFQYLSVYVFYAFFGSLSGGVGAAHYFVGYELATELTIAIFSSTFLLLIVAVLNAHRTKDGLFGTPFARFKWLQTLFSSLGAFAIAVVLCTMRIYGIFSDALISPVSTIVSCISGSFNWNALFFSLASVFLLFACVYLYIITRSSCIGSFSFLLSFKIEETQSKANNYEEYMKKKKQEASSMTTFPPIFASAAISLVLVYILHLPAFSYGNTTNIYPQLLIIFAIACLSQVGVALFNPHRD